MSRQDPQECTGRVPTPPGPPCKCGVPWAAHKPTPGERGKATAGGPAGPVQCGGYTPKEADGAD